MYSQCTLHYALILYIALAEQDCSLYVLHDHDHEVTRVSVPNLIIIVSYTCTHVHCTCMMLDCSMDNIV